MALDRCVIGAMHRDAARHVLFSDPRIASRIAETLTQRLNALEHRLRDTICKTVPQRVAGTLLALSRNAPIHLHSSPESCEVWITHEQLAGLVGSHRETVTKVALGGLPFAVLVWRPALAAAPLDEDQRAAADAGWLRQLCWVIRIGCVLFFLTNLLWLVAQVVAAASVPGTQTLGAPAIQILSGRTGVLWLARVALILAIGLFTWRLPPLSQRAAPRWWAMLALSSAVLLTFSLTSHSAALEYSVFAITLDWLHLAAMVAWIGGLIPLLLAIRAARHDPERAVPLTAIIPRGPGAGHPAIRRGLHPFPRYEE